MDYPNLTSFIKSEGRSLAKGPIALLFIEDDVEVETTLDHHIKLGFKQIIVLATSLPDVDEDTLTQVTTVDVDTFADDCVAQTVNTLMPHMAGAWVYVGFNAKYLLEIASQVDRENAVFMFNSSGDPTLMREGNDTTAVYVVMPMRV